MPLHVAHATVLPINPSGNRTVIYYVTGKSTTRSVEYMNNRGAAHGKDDAAPYVACLQVAQSANRCAEHIISCVQRSTRAEHGDAPIDSWAWALESQVGVWDLSHTAGCVAKQAQVQLSLKARQKHGRSSQRQKTKVQRIAVYIVASRDTSITNA